MPESRMRARVRRSLGAVTVLAFATAGVLTSNGLLPDAVARATTTITTAPDATPVTIPDATPGVVATGTASPSSTIQPGQRSPRRLPTTAAPRAVITITARPTSDRGFLITETMAATGANHLSLRRPQLVGAGLARAQPRVALLGLAIDGRSVATPARLGRELVITTDGSTRRVVVRYKIRGTTMTTASSRPGRTLAAITPVITGVPAGTTVVVTVRGATVLSITCPRLGAGHSSCGVGTRPRLSTADPLPYARSMVLVQYDRVRPPR